MGNNGNLTDFYGFLQNFMETYWNLLVFIEIEGFLGNLRKFMEIYGNLLKFMEIC